jgi:predicted ATPase
MDAPSRIGGRFEIAGRLGSGAMGDVFKGLDIETGEPVAIKLLKPELVKSHPDLVERFAREGDALRRLNHPNIVGMLATIQEDDKNFLVMEYVGGGSLRDRLRESPQMGVTDALQLMLDLSDALTRAHRLGIIHRDLKPDNVLIADDGTPRLTDFGIALFSDEDVALTVAGSVLGTYAYLSPEAALGKALDERTDIWAFGVMLFEMLAGQRPFEHGMIGALINAILMEPVPNLADLRPDVGEDLLDLTLRMLDKNPAARIPSVRLVGAEIESILKGRGTSGSRTFIPVSASTLARFGTNTAVIASPTPTTRHNLPLQTTPFVGRTQELTDLEGMLVSADCRLISLIGPGGMGKTRLSIEAATRQLEIGYPHGVYFVPLASLSDSMPLLATVAESLNFEAGGGDPKAGLLNYLSEKELLLVMDNFEHVLDGAALVDEILSAAPGVRILTTTRSRLNLTSECLYELHGLKIPEAADDAAFEGSEAVEMFVTYARRVQPGYELADAERPAILRIVRLLGGLPLGLELAAAWVRVLDPAEIADEIEGNLDFLENNAADLPARHRSIRAVFDYSWNLLTDREREVFTRLAIFRGGFTRDAAKAVAGASIMELMGLVDKSLVFRNREGRFEVHELLREYAEHLLENNPALAEEIKQAHSACYLSYVSGQNLETGRGLRKFLQTMDDEADNVRLAIKQGVAGRAADLLAPVLEPLSAFLEARSSYDEALDIFQGIADAFHPAGGRESRLLHYRANARLATFLQRLSRYDESGKLLREAVPVFRELGNAESHGLGLGWLSYNLMIEGDIAEGTRTVEEGLALFQKDPALRDKKGLIAYQEAHLGYLLFLDGQYDRAKAVMSDSLTDSLEVDNMIGAGYGYNNLGELEFSRGNYDEARHLYQSAHQVFTDMRNVRGRAFTATNLGNVASARGEFDAAREYFRQSISIYQDYGDRVGLANTLNALGMVQWFSRDFPGATQTFTEALKLQEAAGNLIGMVTTNALLTSVALVRGQFDDALELGLANLELARSTEAGPSIFMAAAHLGSVFTVRGDYDIARATLKEGADNAYGAINLDSVVFHSMMGFTLLNLGEALAAESYLSTALEIARRLNIPYPLVIALSMNARQMLHQGNHSEARAYLEEALQIVQRVGMGVGVAFVIGAFMVLLAEEGAYQTAVQLYAFCMTEAMHLDWDIKRLDSIRQKLMETLSPATLDALMDKGKTLDFESAVSLLAVQPA